MQVKVYFIYIKHALVGRKQSAKRSARIQLFYKCNNKVAGACNFIKKGTLALVFYCEFCETSKNTFFTEHLWTTASDTTTVILSSIFHHI